MPQLASRGLVLRAREMERCRVFSPGDEVLLCGREILVGRANLCAFLMQNLCPVLAGMERGIALGDLGVTGDEPVFHCRGFDCGARFACRQLEPRELVELRAALLGRPAPDAAPAASPAAVATSVSTAPAGDADAGAPAPEQGKPMTPGDREEGFAFSSLAPASDSTLPASKRFGGRVDAAKPFLEQLPSDLGQRLLDRCQRRMQGAGEVVLEQGQPGRAVYFVLKGEVAVERRIDTGEAMQLAILGAGEVFGEMALLSGEPCNATVRTTVKTLLAVLAGSELDHVMGEVPQLHRWFSHLFAERMRATNVRLEEQLTRGMSGRLSMIGLLDLVQTLMMARKSGILVLRRESETGVLRLREGQVRSAFAGELSEEQAFMELCKWTDGTFAFREGAPSGLPTNIQRDTMHILMHAARAQDEGAR